MANRLTSLHRSSNSLTNNEDLDPIGYLFRLPFLLYCTTLKYLDVRRLMKLCYYLQRSANRVVSKMQNVPPTRALAQNSASVVDARNANADLGF